MSQQTLGTPMPVYNANELNYMNGISGTRLFMPMADITRAELAQVFYNMAGKPAQGDIFTPTKFDDVDPFAWYARADCLGFRGRRGHRL